MSYFTLATLFTVTTLKRPSHNHLNDTFDCHWAWARGAA